MNPIEFEVEQIIRNSAKAICEKVLDVNTWSDFDGHGLLPGVEKAVYIKRTDEIVGSRIRVKNSDGSEHLEVVLEWEENKKLVMKIFKFPTILRYMATHFIEEWSFEEFGNGETLVTRKFQLFPYSIFTRPLVMQLSGFFKKAVIAHLDEMAE